MQRAARGGALVAVDQEGGAIRALPLAGPEPSQPAQGSPGRVRQLDRGAAQQLRGLGVNVDLAPVADVPVGASVMGGRSFTGGPGDVAARTRAAVLGFRAGRVAATAKHFPGLGAATVNTDDGAGERGCAARLCSSAASWCRSGRP